MFEIKLVSAFSSRLDTIEESWETKLHIQSKTQWEREE